MKPLRAMVYDATWVGRTPTQTFLTSSWMAGAALYRGLDRLDACYGATSWSDALAWLCEVERGRAISQLQYWGHGTWGAALIGTEVLDRQAVDDEAHPLHDDLRGLRARMTPSSLCWFRTCETFGTEKGHAFAVSWTRFFGCRAAGHTYVIGPWQSGLHSLAPGATPSWSVDEGLPPGVVDPKLALMSSRTAPRTITCLHGAVPDGW
jgi:hypothetical protein